MAGVSRFGICEWYGQAIETIPAARREVLADMALSAAGTAPRCPFQSNESPCAKPGGVCSIRRYEQGPDNTPDPAAASAPVITCPRRFEQHGLPARWLGDIVGFEAGDMQVAT